MKAACSVAVGRGEDFKTTGLRMLAGASTFGSNSNDQNRLQLHMSLSVYNSLSDGVKLSPASPN